MGARRRITIEDASIAMSTGQSDAVYELLTVNGSPAVVGAHIIDALTTCEMSHDPEDGVLYMNIRIKIVHS